MQLAAILSMALLTMPPYHASTGVTLCSRYVRLFNLLLYASLTSRFAVLRTPRGMGELVRRGALTRAEYNALLQTGMGHHAVLEWIATLLNSALSDG